MTKQNSQPKHSVDGPSTEQQKPCSKRKKMGSEIDEIFAGKKRERSENDKKADSSTAAKSGDKKKKAPKNGRPKSLKEKGLVDSTWRPRKKTADGLVVYTEEELGIGKPDAGGTPLCPFDCDCCF